jgi:beta-lactamase superfamily II metal-dependent hydrolase
MSEDVFRLHALPAGNGDALVLEYGNDGQTSRILIDGGVGPAATAVGQFLGESADLDLLVVTHIDNDHIAGMVNLLKQPHPPAPKQVWFNGFRHLPDTGLQAMGPIEGEKLTTIIVDRGYAWNASFDEGPVAITQPAPAKPPSPDPINDLKLTVLSPGVEQLRRLRQGTNWADIVRAAGLDPNVPLPPPPEPAPGLERMGPPDIDALADQKTDTDDTVANGSSIVLLAEFAKRTCLLTGDAHPDVLIAGIDQLVDKDNVLEVDVFKLPHHGSKANVTKKLLSRIRAHTYVFSTDGSGNQRHPNDQAVARVIKYGGPSPQLVFNYRSDRNSDWDSDLLRDRWGYETVYPSQDKPGISVDLVAIER